MPALEELLLSLFATTKIYKHLHQSSWIFVLYLLHFPFLPMPKGVPMRQLQQMAALYLPYWLLAIPHTVPSFNQRNKSTGPAI